MFLTAACAPSRPRLVVLCTCGPLAGPPTSPILFLAVDGQAYHPLSSSCAPSRALTDPLSCANASDHTPCTCTQAGGERCATEAGRLQDEGSAQRQERTQGRKTPGGEKAAAQAIGVGVRVVFGVLVLVAHHDFGVLVLVAQHNFGVIVLVRTIVLLSVLLVALPHRCSFAKAYERVQREEGELSVVVQHARAEVVTAVVATS